jgi:hypothetical protein
MARISPKAIAAAIGFASIASGVSAQTVAPLTFTRLSGLIDNGYTAPYFNRTGVFRAELPDIGSLELFQIELFDTSNVGFGSPGGDSGFDLDAIKLSTEFKDSASGALSAAGLTVFDFPSTSVSAGSQRPPKSPKQFGANAVGGVDPSATLDRFDGKYFTSGYVSLGFGGSILFNLADTTPSTGSKLYLYVGEVGGQGESITGNVFLTAASPPIPEPGTWALMLSGLGLLAGVVTRRHGRRR